MECRGARASGWFTIYVVKWGRPVGFAQARTILCARLKPQDAEGYWWARYRLRSIVIKIRINSKVGAESRVIIHHSGFRSGSTLALGRVSHK